MYALSIRLGRRVGGGFTKARSRALKARLREWYAKICIFGLRAFEKKGTAFHEYPSLIDAAPSHCLAPITAHAMSAYGYNCSVRCPLVPHRFSP